MRKDKLVAGLFLLVLALNFAVAEQYKEKIEFVDGDFRTTITTYYDNDDRYSTYDYRHGYSYRATRDYWDTSLSKEIVKRVEKHEYKGHEDCDDYDDDFEERHFVRHEDYNDDEVKCYHSAPRGKLFYIEC